MRSPLAVVVPFLILGAFFTVLERIRPARPHAPLLARARLPEIASWIVNPTAGRALTFVGVVVVLVPLVLLIGAPHSMSQFEVWQRARSPIRGLPRPAQVLVTMIVVDFVGYWAHRLFHGPRWLWRIHAVHHATRDLDWLSSGRGHPLNEALGGLMIAVPLVLVGLDPRPLEVLAPLTGVWAVFIHANVPWRLGWLRYVVATPLFHRWHHARAVPRGGCNFATFFPLWDLLFGTFHVPDRQPEELGTDEELPRGFFAQLAYPLRRDQSASSSKAPS
jgi:sterol desaturase/sphingolipid hydroxylase (fatty acid hydroxylase superfamily)